MARRVLDRRKLRQEAEQAGPPPEGAPEVLADPAEGVKKAPRKAAAPRPRAPRKKKEPVRMRARWGVFDNAMKQVAVFDYNERPAADQKLADLRASKKTLFFLQLVKEPLTPALTSVATG